MEAALTRGAREIMAGILEQHLNDRRDDLQGTTLPCACGAPAAYKGHARKTFQSTLGPLALERAYYHCAQCGRGWHPQDAALGLTGRSVSPGVERMIGTAAAQVSFDRARGMLEDLAGVRLSTSLVERTAKGLGAAVAADERTVIEPEPCRAPTAYLGLDGTGVPMRAAETAGRAGKQPDGSAGTRETKLAVFWTAEAVNAKGLPERDRGSVRVSAAIESAASRPTDPEPSPFAQRVRRLAERCGYFDAERRVVLGDGAPWIWNLAYEVCPGAIQIVDLWHAKEKLWECGRALWGTGERTEEWAEARCDDLELGRFDIVLESLRGYAAECEAFRLAQGYFDDNRARMRYAEFRAQGLCVGSGVVEAGCKTVVGERCKQSGMHWTVLGVNHILALRSCVLSGRYEDYWARRAETV